jgi:hypothetical protein
MSKRVLFRILVAGVLWGTSGIVSAQWQDMSSALNLFTGHTGGYLGSGVSVVDFNGDGFDDLSFCNHTGVLFFYAGDGAGGFTPVQFGIDNGSADAKSVSWVDIDNDGDQDLFIANRLATNGLWRNDGEQGFTDITLDSGLDLENRKSYGASFADYDNDGDLDLFVANYNAAPTEMMNELYSNNGDGTFTQTTFLAGLGQDIKQTFLGEWTDFNEDGLLDLYLIRDRHAYHNIYYENQGDGTFLNTAWSRGLDLAINAMCSAIGDYNRDGAMDVYVSGLQDENVLLTNDGSGNFEDLGSDPFAIWHTCWAGTWVDWDNNGWQELHVATGTSLFTNYPSILTTIDQIPDSMFTFDGESWSAVAGSGLPAEHSFSVATADLNGDGFLDLASCPIDSFASIYFATPNGNHYLRVKGEGVESNRDAIGVKYRLYANGDLHYRMSKSGEGYLTQGSRWQHFGLGEVEAIDSLVVTWPTGLSDVFYDLPVDASILVVEGAAEWQCTGGGCLPAPGPGCTYPAALNYEPDAEGDDGSCLFGPTADACGEGTIWDEASSTCVAVPDACPADVNGDNFVGIADLLDLLESFSTVCPE